MILPGLVVRERRALAPKPRPWRAQHVGEAAASLGDVAPGEAAVAEDEALALGDRLGEASWMAARFSMGAEVPVQPKRTAARWRSASAALQVASAASSRRRRPARPKPPSGALRGAAAPARSRRRGAACPAAPSASQRTNTSPTAAAPKAPMRKPRSSSRPHHWSALVGLVHLGRDGRERVQVSGDRRVAPALHARRATSCAARNAAARRSAEWRAPGQRARSPASVAESASARLALGGACGIPAAVARHVPAAVGALRAHEERRGRVDRRALDRAERDEPAERVRRAGDGGPRRVAGEERPERAVGLAAPRARAPRSRRAAPCPRATAT